MKSIKEVAHCVRPDVWFFNDIDMREVERARASDLLMFIP